MFAVYARMSQLEWNQKKLHIEGHAVIRYNRGESDVLFG